MPFVLQCLYVTEITIYFKIKFLTFKKRMKKYKLVPQKLVLCYCWRSMNIVWIPELCHISGLQITANLISKSHQYSELKKKLNLLFAQYFSYKQSLFQPKLDFARELGQCTCWQIQVLVEIVIAKLKSSERTGFVSV